MVRKVDAPEVGGLLERLRIAGQMAPALRNAKPRKHDAATLSPSDVRTAELSCGDAPYV